MPILITLLTIVEVLICLLLILVIMMQRPRQEGLGASFGSGVMDQIAGVQTTNVLQKGTAWLAGAMFVTTILLASLVAKEHHNSKKTLFEAPKPVAAAEKTPEVKPAAGEPAKAAAPATNGPAMKLTPGGTTTSPVISVKPEDGTSTQLPNGAGTVVVKPTAPAKATTPPATTPVAPAPATTPAPAPTATPTPAAPSAAAPTPATPVPTK